MYWKRITILGAAACVATAVAVQAGISSSAKVRTAAACPVTNAEAIIDDSGSMSFTDDHLLRRSAMALLIDKKTNANKTLGAVEFGDTAGPIFAPQQIGPNAAAMKASLANALKADNGTTDYNIAFSTGKSQNPNANGWLFLTDGGHNVGTYANGHVGLAPVMVVGLGIGPSGKGSADADRLQKIADDTGGQYFPAQNAASLQATVNSIDAIWRCQQPPKQFTDQFTQQGQSRPHAVSVPKGVKTAEITTTYSDPNSRFDIVGIQIIRRGKIVAASNDLTAKKRNPRPRRVKLRITRTRGSTYVIVRVSKMVPGKLRFKVRATKLGSEFSGVTTQVGR